MAAEAGEGEIDLPSEAKPHPVAPEAPSPPSGDRQAREMRWHRSGLVSVDSL